jgi:hypothetical protein
MFGESEYTGEWVLSIARGKEECTTGGGRR